MSARRKRRLVIRFATPRTDRAVRRPASPVRTRGRGSRIPRPAAAAAVGHHHHVWRAANIDLPSISARSPVAASRPLEMRARRPVLREPHHDVVAASQQFTAGRATATAAPAPTGIVVMIDEITGDASVAAIFCSGRLEADERLREADRACATGLCQPHRPPSGAGSAGARAAPAPGGRQHVIAGRDAPTARRSIEQRFSRLGREHRRRAVNFEDPRHGEDRWRLRGEVLHIGTSMKTPPSPRAPAE